MIGVSELIASILILLPCVHTLTGKWQKILILRPFGAILAILLMTGAIGFHLFTPLGIVQPYFDSETGVQVGNDQGLLFIMACVTWVCALVLLIVDRNSVNASKAIPI